MQYGQYRRQRRKPLSVDERFVVGLMYICARYPEERSKTVKGILALKSHSRINGRSDNVLTHIDHVVGDWWNATILGRLKRVGIG